MADSRMVPFEIRECPGGVFEVVQDGKTTGPLCFGELIEQVAGMTAPFRKVDRIYPMKTPEQWARRFDFSNGESHG